MNKSLKDRIKFAIPAKVNNKNIICDIIDNAVWWNVCEQDFEKYDRLQINVAAAKKAVLLTYVKGEVISYSIVKLI